VAAVTVASSDTLLVAIEKTKSHSTLIEYPNRRRLFPAHTQSRYAPFLSIPRRFSSWSAEKVRLKILSHFASFLISSFMCFFCLISLNVTYNKLHCSKLHTRLRNLLSLVERLILFSHTTTFKLVLARTPQPSPCGVVQTFVLVS